MYDSGVQGDGDEGIIPCFGGIFTVGAACQQGEGCEEKKLGFHIFLVLIINV
ncbi:hypothetical protein BACCELL_00275 [Bacteroides cellulosilyticus DSM 14838]|uniref:Uncharacterized protein n=1 Tax=Bacteroides cellulosilyticus DSM 14838 TaxID=537012 RepID=E2N7N2_9BACE|nr:hypothetical protein BACCELL_00275 [Bacteroides cellulosilyticus DSM 14838]